MIQLQIHHPVKEAAGLKTQPLTGVAPLCNSGGTAAMDDGVVAVGGDGFDVITRMADGVGEEVALLRDAGRLDFHGGDEGREGGV